tara:strand:- start:668 stop:940 length:273 start_codon:yes stop_codon:yes gene_type:complete
VSDFELILLWGIFGGPFFAIIITLYGGIVIQTFKEKSDEPITVATIMLFYLPTPLVFIYFILQAPIPGIISALWTGYFLQSGVWDGIFKK